MNQELKEYIERDFQNTPLFVKLLHEQLGDKDVLFVLKTIDEVCTNCWDSNSDCMCWNDE